MYNVACAVKKATSTEVTIYRDIDAGNVRSAMLRARVDMAIACGVKRSEVIIKCFCSANSDLHPACDPALRGVCERLK